MESKDQNTLVVLPTGLGKTIIILYLVRHFKKKYPYKKIIVATPTRPLVHQIGETFRKHLDIDPDFILEVAGSIAPKKREKLYLDAQVLIGTPQTFSNDFDAERITPSDFSLLCFDEAHRATGNYAYVKIVQNFEDEGINARIIGFTATPGNKPEQVEAVIKNLHITAIRSRFDDDSDVKPYISTYRPKVIWVNLPDSYKQVVKLLDVYQTEIVDEIKKRGLEPGRYINKRTALDLQSQVSILMKEDPNMGELLFFIPNLIRILHLKEMIETQGFPQGNATLAKWHTTIPSKKTLTMFLEHPHIQNVYHTMTNDPLPHPKLQKLIDILQDRMKQPDSKIIIFSNYRNTIDFLLVEFTKHNIKARKFVGQAGQKKGSSGMSQKEQLAVLEEFKSGDLNLLISTSVGEEGLDVGACDLVIFYDSVSSVVRSVQRTGRGRKKHSEVIRLVTRGTKDAALYYSMLQLQKKIQKFIRHELPAKLNLDIKAVTSIKQLTNSQPKFPVTSTPSDIEIEPQAKTGKLMEFLNQKTESKNSTLTKNVDNSVSAPIPSPSTTVNTMQALESIPTAIKEGKLLVLVDNREARSLVPRLLKKDKSTKIQLLNLAEGDYRVSEECVIERKTVQDLAESLVDGRLFDQVSQKLSTYKKPIIIIEGLDSDLKLNIKPAALRGAIAAIVLGFKIPVLRTLSEEETAEMIRAIAKREQKEKTFQPNIQAISRQYPIREIQRFLLAAIPGVNRTKADQLLTEFQTIQNLVNAQSADLMKLEGIGKILTDRILRILQESASDKDRLE